MLRRFFIAYTRGKQQKEKDQSMHFTNLLNLAVYYPLYRLNFVICIVCVLITHLPVCY
jgi:hypothetical protein